MRSRTSQWESLGSEPGGQGGGVEAASGEGVGRVRLVAASEAEWAWAARPCSGCGVPSTPLARFYNQGIEGVSLLLGTEHHLDRLTG